MDASTTPRFWVEVGRDSPPQLDTGWLGEIRRITFSAGIIAAETDPRQGSPLVSSLIGRPWNQPTRKYFVCMHAGGVDLPILISPFHRPFRVVPSEPSLQARVGDAGTRDLRQRSCGARGLSRGKKERAAGPCPNRARDARHRWPVGGCGRRMQRAGLVCRRPMSPLAYSSGAHHTSCISPPFHKPGLVNIPTSCPCRRTLRPPMSTPTAACPWRFMTIRRIPPLGS